MTAKLCSGIYMCLTAEITCKFQDHNHSAGNRVVEPSIFKFEAVHIAKRCAFDHAFRRLCTWDRTSSYACSFSFRVCFPNIITIIKLALIFPAKWNCKCSWWLQSATSDTKRVVRRHTEHVFRYLHVSKLYLFRWWIDPAGRCGLTCVWSWPRNSRLMSGC